MQQKLSKNAKEATAQKASYRKYDMKINICITLRVHIVRNNKIIPINRKKLKTHKEENNIKIKNVLNYKLSSPENSYQFSSVTQSCPTLCEPMVNKGNCHSLKLGI